MEKPIEFETGTRYHIKTGTARYASGVIIDEALDFEATPTDTYETHDGIRRRLLVDCNHVEFDEIWINIED